MSEHKEKVALYRKAGRLLLPHGEKDPAKQYIFPDPLHEPFIEAEQKARYNPQALTRTDLLALCSLAAAYRTLTSYELGQECCVKQLRDIWRARRETLGGGE
ncbi:MAG: hypothetical protein ACTSX8_05565 [Alphaproteobacteria bacterium]